MLSKHKKTDLEYFEKLLKKYQKKPELCAYCGRPLIFKEFVKQYDQEKKYCSKNCYNLLKKANTPLKPGFSSATEEVIYNFLTSHYPDLEIQHNVSTIIAPYELDFVIDKYKLVIEYNGQLHYVNRYNKKRERRTKLNDSKKKKLLMLNGYCLCRLWSELGLYTRPTLFRKALNILKDQITKCINNTCRYGTVIDVLVSIDEEISIICQK